MLFKHLRVYSPPFAAVIIFIEGVRFVALGEIPKGIQVQAMLAASEGIEHRGSDRRGGHHEVFDGVQQSGGTN